MPKVWRLAAHEGFCVGADLLPADLAAAAIYVRADPIVDVRSGAFDMKAEDPENYASCILDPLGDDALDYPALDADELQEELALEDQEMPCQASDGLEGRIHQFEAAAWHTTIKVSLSV